MTQALSTEVHHRSITMLVDESQHLLYRCKKWWEVLQERDLLHHSDLPHKQSFKEAEPYLFLQLLRA
jgi:hypothetical protein